MKTKKNGKRRGIQTYKCLLCECRFQNKRRKKKLEKNLLHKYIWKRQTYSDLSEEYNKSKKWIQRKLDEVEVKPIVKIDERNIIVVADVTFFSRIDGLCVFREPNLKKNIWWRHTIHENADIYLQGIIHLEKNGFKIKAVVLDGKRGVRRVFKDIPVQMCHFHQKQIIRRYLTNKPKLESSIELKQITKTLTYTNEQTFTKELNEWHEKWKDWLKEKTTNPETGKQFYKHKKVRSAFRSLKSNLPFLFTYQKYPELNIPNTTNSLDGYFNVLKSKLNVHRGLTHKRRKKVVIELLKGKKLPK
jgi:hypothetical protein